MLMRLLPLVLGIVLSACLMGGILLWTRYRPRPTAAEREAEKRASYTRTPLPPPGAEVLILAEDGSGTSHELEAVHWPELGWIDAVTLLPVEDAVIGWRNWPFRRPEPPVDYSTWSREQIAAELERRFGNAER